MESIEEEEEEEEEEEDIILPTKLFKYPGCVWQESIVRTKKRFRAAYPLAVEDPVSKNRKVYDQFDTEKEAIAFIVAQSELDGHNRVKNVIHKVDNHYECELSGGKRLLFDKEDMTLVQSYTWRSHTTGHVQTNKFDELPSTLFHLCVMGKPDEKHEVTHLNGRKNDNRRANMKIVPRHSRTKKIGTTVNILTK